MTRGVPALTELRPLLIKHFYLDFWKESLGAVNKLLVIDVLLASHKSTCILDFVFFFDSYTLTREPMISGSKPEVQTIVTYENTATFSYRLPIKGIDVIVRPIDL